MADFPQSTAGTTSLDRVIWWVVAVVGAAGVVYAGVMSYLVLSSIDWDVLFGRLDYHPAGAASTPPPPPPLAPEMPAGPGAPVAPGVPGAPAAPGAPVAPGAAVPPGPSAIPAPPAAPPAAPRPR